MDALILRFDAPLMSFGGVIVDHHNVTDRFPGISMFAGLMANAMGWSHGDSDKIGTLQERLAVASRWDVDPQAVCDYQTVDLGQPKMRDAGWTTRGEAEHRDGGPDAKFGTHIRYRHYWANGVLTSAVALGSDGIPDLLTLRDSLLRPVRPLFFGRKACIPNSPIVVGLRSGNDLLAILRCVPRFQCPVRPARNSRMPARWPSSVGDNREDQLKVIYDQRDWRNQWHAGRRIVAEGFIEEAPACS